MGKTFHYAYPHSGTTLRPSWEFLKPPLTVDLGINNFHFRIMGGAPYSHLYDTTELIVNVPEGTPASYTHVEDCLPKVAGTIRNLWVNCTQNQRMVDTTISILVSGAAPTACEVVIPAFATGEFHGTGEITFTNTDYVVGVVNSDDMDPADPEFVGVTIDLDNFCLEVESDSTHNSVLFAGPTNNDRGHYEDSIDPGDEFSIIGSGAILYWGSSRTVYALPVSGSTSPFWTAIAANEAGTTPIATLETPLRHRVRSAGTFGSMMLWVQSNSADTTTTFRRRINGANGSASVTVAAGQTGWFQTDTTDTVSSGDYVSYSATNATATGGSMNVLWVMSNFQASDGKVDIYCNSLDDASNTSQASYLSDTFCPRQTGEQYYPINGAWETGDADTDPASAKEVEVPFDTTFSKLRFYVSYFNGDDFYLGTFVNGQHGFQRVLVNGTGWFEDTVNTDTLSGCNRRICYYTLAADGEEGIAHIEHISMTYTAGTESDCPDFGGGGGGTGGPDSEEPCELECPTGMSFEALKHRALKLCGQDWRNPVYWSDDEMGRYVNDAYIDICRETKALELIEAVKLEAETNEARLSDRVAQIFRVTWDDRKIENTTKWELDRTVPNWEDDAGFIDSYVTSLHDQRRISTYKAWDGSEVYGYEHFYNDAYTYIAWANAQNIDAGDRRTVVGTDGLKRGYSAILPHTAATATNKPGSGSAWETYWVPLALMVWATKNPAPLVSEACADVELPPWSHVAIAYRAAARALRKRGEMRNEKLAAAYWSIADDYVALLKGLVASRAPERVVAMGRGYGRVRRNWIPLVET